jgi:hypothetical protein
MTIKKNDTTMIQGIMPLVASDLISNLPRKRNNKLGKGSDRKL